MRTIKFRKWHKELQDMTFWDGSKGSNNLFWHTLTEYPEMYSLMQFTGLHDKNGKEIYEWDILEDYLGRRKVVEYYQDGFWLNASLEGAEWSLRHTHKSSKIIGNIYEHKFLLDEN